MHNIILFLKKKDLYLGIIRYVLSMFMIGFGTMNILGMQFNMANPLSAWQQPLEHLTGAQHSSGPFLCFL